MFKHHEGLADNTPIFDSRQFQARSYYPKVTFNLLLADWVMIAPQRLETPEIALEFVPNKVLDRPGLLLLCR